jgi:hypothetical protein
MVSRIGFCARAGATLPHCRGYLDHSRVDTTQLYTDDLDADELAAALARALKARELQAWSGSETEDEATLKFPRNRLMEAVGIEPTSAAAPAERLQA